MSTLTSSDVTLDVAWPFRFSLLIVSSRSEKNSYSNRNRLRFSYVQLLESRAQICILSSAFTDITTGKNNLI